MSDVKIEVEERKPAVGQIYVYTPDGQPVKRSKSLNVPPRFGGKDGKNLFITARAGLCAVRR